VLAVVLHPEVQAKAQKELDNVLGNGRLPDFCDRKSLPYISAVVKEVLRSVNNICPTVDAPFRFPILNQLCTDGVQSHL
jgi:hypothetical protein